MGWMDLTVAVLLIVSIIRGWTRGFILTVFHMVGFILSWIIAKTYYKLLSMYIIVNTDLLPTFQNLINKRLKNSAGEEEIVGGAITDYNIYEVLKLPKTIEELMKSENVIMDYGNKAAGGIYQYMSQVFAQMFIDLVSFFIMFLVVKLIITIIAHVLDGVVKLPLLREFNRLGGGIVGGIKGLLIVFIILALLIPFVTITNNHVIMEGLEKSRLAKYIYDNNPIISILEASLPLGKSST